MQQLFIPESSPTPEPFAGPSKHPLYRVAQCCKCSGPNARSISCKCCQEECTCVSCILGGRGICVNILNVTRAGEQLGNQKSSPTEAHQQPVFPSSLLSNSTASNVLPPSQLPSSLSVSQQKLTSLPTLVPEPPQTARTQGQREICVVQGCTELIATNMWMNHLNLHAQGLLPGTVPDTWLLEHGRVICPHCSHLVARSHIASHFVSRVLSPRL